MKTLGLLLLVVIGSIGFMNWRQANIERQAKDRARAEAMVAEMQAVDAARAAVPTPGPGRKVSWDPATKRYVEHASNVSLMQSHGGGGYNGPVKATPEPRTALDRGAYNKR